MTVRVTLLGTGSSGGVPRIGNIWGNCDPQNPRNRRRRCAALVQKRQGRGVTTVLIDTPPDIRQQLIDTRVDEIDSLLYTHDHADHTHGIDDLRVVSYGMKRRIPAYCDRATLTSLTTRFGYCFKPNPGSSYPAILNAHEIAPGDRIDVDGNGGRIAAIAIGQTHGDIASLGYRIGALAYSPDVSDIPDASLPLLEGLDVWIVDALRLHAHPSHFSLRDALSWIERLKPRRAILTHMTSELDYATLQRDLPAGVEPGYDGMTIDL